MKKLSNKGFTLIELLAVITIMGILMMVAIPAVSRTIENSRRDTFASVSGEYLSAVRNAILADEIECYYNNGFKVASSLPDGTYFFPICTGKTDQCKGIKVEDVAAAGTGDALVPAYVKVTEVANTDTSANMNADVIIQSSTDLLESGGKSPFGSADMFGYVTWTKTTRAVGDAPASGGTDTRDTKSSTTYYVILQDSGKHGLIAEQPTSGLKRSNVSTSVTTQITNVKAQVTGDDLKTDKAIRGVCKVS